MESYIQYAHNLRGGSGFEKFGEHMKNAITFNYVRQLADYNSLQRAVIEEADKNVLQYISEHLDLRTYFRSIIFTTDRSSYVDDVDFNNVRAIINLRKVNHTQQPNKLFRSVNTLLPDAGIYIGRLETYCERKGRILRKFGMRTGQFLWFVDFILNRIIPRIPYLEKLYYYLTKGQFHAISKSEALGRLVYCGFEIVDFKTINGLSYFVTIKTGEPAKYRNPSYYPIIKLSRVGKNGKMIGVYKFRTMHPYSEYLQEYVVKLNGYNCNGKPSNDFRLTTWGKFFRKYWIDEIPQIINVFRGEMKIVGMRPLSQVRFNEFPEDLKKERIKYKPGCFPPYVALNMPSDKENIEAERIYINDLVKHPFTADVNYLFQAIYNILSNKIRGA